MGGCCFKTMIVPLAPQSEIVYFQNGLFSEAQLARLADGLWDHTPLCISLNKFTPLAQHHNLCTSWSRLKDIINDWQKQACPKPLVIAIYGPWMNPKTVLDHIALNFVFDSMWKWLDTHVEHTIHIAIDGKNAPAWVTNCHPLRFESQ